MKCQTYFTMSPAIYRHDSYFFSMKPDGSTSRASDSPRDRLCRVRLSFNGQGLPVSCGLASGLISVENARGAEAGFGISIAFPFQCVLFGGTL